METRPDGASVALIDGNRVLLVQRGRAPYLGLWTLPGGRLQPGESAEQAAVREIREEIGLLCDRLVPVRRMTLGADGRFLLQVFVTATFEGDLTLNDEISDCRWVAADGFGTLGTTPALVEVVEAAFRLVGPVQMG